MLWSDTLRTVTPPTATASSSATGVRTPVRPTDGAMARMRVVAWRGLNFHATAQRGERETWPRSRCSSRSFTLTTRPSTSNGRASRSASRAAKAPATSSRLFASRWPGVGRRPQSAKACEQLVVRPYGHALDRAHAVAGELQRARRRDARVELLERSGGRVARIGEHRLAGLLALAVEGAERRHRQVDLAAHLETLAERGGRHAGGAERCARCAGSRSRPRPRCRRRGSSRRRRRRPRRPARRRGRRASARRRTRPTRGRGGGARGRRTRPSPRAS